MHKKILKQEKWIWFFQDLGLPLLVTLAILFSGRWFFPRENVSAMFTIFYLGLLYLSSLLCSILISPSARNWVIEGIIRRKAIAK